MGCELLTAEEAKLCAERLRGHGPGNDPGSKSAMAHRDRCFALADKLDRAACSAEIVICSAIRLPDGRIFRGHRHGDCIKTALAVVSWNRGEDPGEHHWHPAMCEDQGFITSSNRYVGRVEGMRLQLAAGVASVADGGYRGGTLFSEDLY